jgi:hypothetical protein
MSMTAGRLQVRQYRVYANKDIYRTHHWESASEGLQEPLDLAYDALLDVGADKHSKKVDDRANLEENLLTR